MCCGKRDLLPAGHLGPIVLTKAEYTRWVGTFRKRWGVLIEIPLDFSSSTPLYRQIADHLRAMIRTGALEEDFRLPGSRRFALFLGMSRTTINEAYNLLANEGLIRLEGRRGTFVQRSGLPATPLLCRGRRWDLASGTPSTDFLPLRQLASLWRSVLQEEENVLLMPPVAGLEALRQALVGHAATRGIPACWQDVLVTSGVQEGLALSLEALRRHGVKRLWTEMLTYPQLPPLAAMGGQELRLLPAHPADWEQVMGTMTAQDAIYLIPSFHNPTGRTLPLALREDLLRQTHLRGCWIVEDDAYGELRYGEFSVPALRALPGAERILYLGSFSQLLFPGWRLGYALVPRELHSAFSYAKMHFSGATATPSQLLVLAFLRQGFLEPALADIRKGMAHRMNTLHTGLRRMFPQLSLEMPQGGVFLWLETPGWSGREAALRARHLGVLVAPGELFAPDRRPVEAVRLAVSRTSVSDLLDVETLLVRAWKDAPWCAHLHS